MTSDRWTLSPQLVQAIAEAFAHHGVLPRKKDISTHGHAASDESARAAANPQAPSTGASPADRGGYEAYPELNVLVDLLGSAETAHDVATLLVEVTAEDIAELDRSIKSCDFDRAALRLHRIVGGYQILGPSQVVDEGRELLLELRTVRSGHTLARLLRFRDRLFALMQRLETGIVSQRAQRLLSA